MTETSVCIGMMSRWEKSWHALRKSRPGQRFEDRYRAASRSASRDRMGERVLRVGLAVVSLAVGVVLVFLPGPAVLFFALAGALLASESLRVARSLDWTELKLRAGGRAMWRGWRGLSVVGRVMASATVSAAVAVAAYGAFRVWVG